VSGLNTVVDTALDAVLIVTASGPNRERRAFAAGSLRTDYGDWYRGEDRGDGIAG